MVLCYLCMNHCRGYITGLVQEGVEGEPTDVSLVKHGGNTTAEVKMLLPTFNNIFKMETLYLGQC